MKRRLRRLSPLQRPPPEGHAGALVSGHGAVRSERDGSGRDGWFSSTVAVIIAVTTLVGAMAGYLLADVSRLADDYRLDAERYSLEAAASVQREQQRAQVSYELFARAALQRTQAANAMLRYVYAGGDPAEAARLQLEIERWEYLADASLAASGIDAEHEFGPGNDPVFPVRYFASATYEGHRLNALQDAANELASFYDEQAAAYTAILALLAISLYLFGLSVAVDDRLFRSGFMLLGVVLLGVAGAWAIVTAGTPRPEISDEAAAEYARGRVAFDTAYDSAGFSAAERHYGRAIELRPTFARAHLERAHAIVLAATPQRAGYVSIIPPDALERQREDLTRAVELGYETGPLFSSLGFGAFLQGMQQDDRALIDESIAHTRRAIALDPTEPVHHYNLGLAFVAAGRYEEARRAYDDAIAWTIYADAARDRERAAPALAQHVLAGALTDLEIVARYQPAAEEQVRQLKEHIVGPVSAARLGPPEPSPLMVGEVQLDVYPAQIGWQADLLDYDPAREIVSTQWYYRGADAVDWVVLPTVSGSLRPTPTDDGRHYVNAYHVTSSTPPACLEPGRYRLEIYVNGRLVQPPTPLEIEPTFDQLEAHVASDVAVAFCRPPDWEPLDEALPGLLTGFRSTDGQYGAYVARIGLPRSFQLLPNLSTDFMDLALGVFGEMLPGETPSYVEAAGTGTYHFLGLSRSAWRWYDSDVGWIRAGAGLADDGAIVVGLVFGPYDWFSDGDWFDIMGSMVRLE